MNIQSIFPCGANMPEDWQFVRLGENLHSISQFDATSGAIVHHSN